jgi:glutamate synthase (NADPH/NADH) small chain
MTTGYGATSVPGISAGRLGAADYARSFSDIHPPLGVHEAVVESDRCYLCFDAPCTAACPTSIDIPLFIRKIGMRNAAEDRPVRIGSSGAAPPTVISPGGLRRRPLGRGAAPVAQ